MNTRDEMREQPAESLHDVPEADQIHGIRASCRHPMPDFDALAVLVGANIHLVQVRPAKSSTGRGT